MTTIGIRHVGDLMERRFAQFAGVPYQTPVCRQQWEELWETEAKKTAPSLDVQDAHWLGGEGQVGRPVIGEGAD